MNTAKPIGSLLESARPSDRAVVLGKGPSLDTYADQSAGDGYVVALNDVALIHKCDAVVFVDDPFDDVSYSDDSELIRHCRWRASHGGRGYAFSLDRDPGELPNCKCKERGTGICGADAYKIPWFGGGTLTAALTILGMWGFRTLRLWGCDSLAQEDTRRLEHATKVQDLQRAEASPSIYARRRKGSLAALEHYKFKWSLEGM